MFFGSPVLYPMSETSGLHYRINEFNPFAYFAEATRHYSGLDAVFFDIDPYVMIPVVSIVLILAIRGYTLLDRLRWEVSSWS
jgi:ABC-type polysaccharide/polyol phosphate export permease